MMCDHVMQDTVSTHLMVLQIMEQLLNKAGDVFVGQFLRLGTSAKLLEIAGPLDKTSDSLLTNSVKNATQDEPDSGAADSSNVTEAGKEDTDSRSDIKEPESEAASGFGEGELKSDSVEPKLESSSKPLDSESKPKEQESEPISKEPNLELNKQPDVTVSETEPSLASSKDPDLESNQNPELVASKEQDSGSSKEPDLEPSQQPDLTSSKELNTDSVMEPELEEAESSTKVDKEATSSEEPVRFNSCCI